MKRKDGFYFIEQFVSCLIEEIFKILSAENRLVEQNMVLNSDFVS